MGSKKAITEAPPRIFYNCKGHPPNVIKLAFNSILTTSDPEREKGTEIEKEME